MRLRHGRLPPESNRGIKPDVIASLQPGSIGAANGSNAIKSSVLAAGGGEVPHVYSVHGRKPVKQFTRLEKIPKDEIGAALEQVLREQGQVVL